MVTGYNGTGVHTLLTIFRLFPSYFRNFVFLSVGAIDFDRFKDKAEIDRLQDAVDQDLKKYVALVSKWGLHAESRSSFGVDVVDELAKVCPEIAREFPRAMFFGGQLVFERPGALTRFLHEQTGEEIQRRLHFEGLTLIMLPIRVMEATP